MLFQSCVLRSSQTNSNHDREMSMPFWLTLKYHSLDTFLDQHHWCGMISATLVHSLLHKPLSWSHYSSFLKWKYLSKYVNSQKFNSPGKQIGQIVFTFFGSLSPQSVSLVFLSSLTRAMSCFMFLSKKWYTYIYNKRLFLSHPLDHIFHVQSLYSLLW